MIDLSYLNRFKEKPVVVTLKTDPYYHRFEEQTKEGLIGEFHPPYSLELCIGDINAKLFRLKTTEHLPYLGNTLTLWKIQEKSGLVLLDHQQIGDKDFRIIGTKNQELGVLRNFPVQYHTPFWTLHEQIVEEKKGDDYSKGMEERAKRFNEWRESLFQQT